MQSKMKEVAIKVSRSYHSICNRYYDYYKFKLNKKQDEIDMLSQLMSAADAKKLAQQHGYEDKQIAKMF